MASLVTHVPLESMQLELSPIQSSFVTWVYNWNDVDLTSRVELYSPHFGSSQGWVWRLILQPHPRNENEGRGYSLFLRVVRTDTELQEPTWTRKIRLMHLQIYNTEGRLMKDRAVDALFNEHRHTFGHQGWTTDQDLLRDPVINGTRRVNICCRLTYRPECEKLRRPMSPPVPGVFSRSGDNSSSNLSEFYNPRAVVLDPVGANLRQILRNPKFSDVELVVGAQRRVFPGHRAILAARSAWFARALDPGFRESHEHRIQLPEDDPAIFELLLDYLYTGEYPIPSRPGWNVTNVLPDSAPSEYHNGISGRFSSLSTSSALSSPRTVSSFPHDDDNTTTASSPPNNMDDMNTFGYFDQGDEEAAELDEVKFRLYLMADRFCVSQLKALIRVQLTNELLDPTVLPNARFLRLVRFAFESLPSGFGNTPSEATSRAPSAMRCGTDSDNPLDSRLNSPSPFGEIYAQSLHRPDTPNQHALSPPRRSGGFATRTQYGLPTPAPDPQQGASPHPPPSTAPGPSRVTEVGVAMTTTDASANTPTPNNQLLRTAPTPSSSQSWCSQSSAPAWARPDSPNSFTRATLPDSETTRLRESVVEYAAKLFPAVQRVPGFEEMITEGGEMGRFAVQVMARMFKP